MMEEVDVSEVSWLDSSGLELINEFLDDKDPAFVFQEAKDSEEPNARRASIINKLISTVYSGPTISDIESALSVTSKIGEPHEGRGNSRHMASSSDKGLGKMENKYTLKIKLCGNGLADDGYKWRKYGQKSIKNSPNPRSYYRCTNPRCNAKKQVERSVEDPETLVVTYEGLHLHYTYSHFLLSQAPHDFPAAAVQAAKKPKSQLQVGATDVGGLPESLAPKSPSPMVVLQEDQPDEAGRLHGYVDQDHAASAEHADVRLFGDFLQSSQGLLEDVVPLLVRKPCNSPASSYDHHFPENSSPSPASSDQSYTTTLSWNPFDYGILSTIM